MQQAAQQPVKGLQRLRHQRQLHERIRPKAGECTIQQKRMFEDDKWDNVNFVYGYYEDYSVTKNLVDWTDASVEMRDGRPKGSWRVKVH